MKLRIVALALTSLLLTASSLRAQSTWSGAVDNDYNNAGNWNTPPGSGANLLFTGAGSTVNLTTGVTVGNINLNSGGYTFTGTSSPTLTLNGNISAFINADFQSSIGSIALTGTVHTMAVLPSQFLNIHAPLTGTGASLFKDGYGTLSLYGANTYDGATTVNAGTLALDGSGASITHGGANLTVTGPVAGYPTLSLTSGAQVTNAVGRIAIGANDQGYVGIDGIGSTWTNNGYLYVGEAGTGTLDITTGGTVTAANISIGNNGGGSGMVTVEGSGSSLHQTDNTVGNGLYVGSAGTGTLLIQNGADVTSVDSSIGNNPGGNGMVNITGAGSAWANSGNLYVGATTTGSLNITAGAMVASNNVTLGNSAGGDGGLTVDGTGTALTVTAALQVGWQGSGTMQISNGGNVTSATGVLGEQSSATGIAKIYDSGSSLGVSGTDFYVGNGGTGTLYLYNQGKVSVGGGTGTIDLGHSAGGVGNLYIGYNGATSLVGGVINAASILSGSRTGTVHLSTTATAPSPYYLTNDATSTGTAVAIGGGTTVTNDAGYNVISGTNTYTGNTDIYAGTLVAAGTNLNPLGTTGTVTVHGGGTLAVYNSFINNPIILQSGSRLTGNTSSGSIGDALIGAGVTLSPGFTSDAVINGPLGGLQFSTLTLGPDSTLEIKVKDASGLTNNSVTVSNTSGLDITATTGNPLTLKLISLDGSYNPGALAGGVTLNMMSSLPFLSADSPTGTFTLGDNLILDTSMFNNGITSMNDFTLTFSSNTYYLNFTPVPEPSTYALLALGLAGSGFAAWRKRRRA